jgi:hypothetical protein
MGTVRNLAMTKPDIYIGEDETTVVDRLDIGVDHESSSIELEPGNTATITVGYQAGAVLDADGNLTLGWDDAPGDLELLRHDPDANALYGGAAGGPAPAIVLEAEDASATVGGADADGLVEVSDNEGDSKIQLTAGGESETGGNNVVVDGAQAEITVGNMRASVMGSIELMSRSTNSRSGAVMDGDGNLTLGGRAIDGTVELLRPHTVEEDGRRGRRGKPSITLEAEDGTATVGGAGADGHVKLQNSGGATTAEVRGDRGQITTGGTGTAGSILLKNDQANPVGRLTASGDDVVFTTLGGGGGDETVAMRIRPDGTVEFPQGGP